MATFRDRVIANLSNRRGMTIEDDNATAKLARAMRIPASQMPGLSSALKRMEENGEIERTVIGRRTKSITLLAPAAASNGHQPAPEAPQAASDEDYVRMGLGVLQAASRLMQENDELRATVEAQKAELKQTRKEADKALRELQAIELDRAALTRQMAEVKASAAQVVATLAPETKSQVQSLLTKVRRLG